MPRAADTQAADHYGTAMTAMRFAAAEQDTERRLLLMLEALTHAVLDLGVGLAELQQQRAATGPELAEHDEGTSYCTSAPEHSHGGPQFPDGHLSPGCTCTHDPAMPCDRDCPVHGGTDTHDAFGRKRD